MPFESLRELLTKQTAAANRSTVLQPLYWLMGMLIPGLIWAAYARVPTWILIVLTTILIIAAIFFLFFFGYFAVKNPDALRSERFTLSKMALEKNLIGDSTAGLVAVADELRPRSVALPAPHKDEP